MPHDPLRLLLHLLMLHLRLAPPGRVTFERAWLRWAWVQPHRRSLTGLAPWLVTLLITLAAALGVTAPPRSAAPAAPAEQLQQAELPALERSSALAGRHLSDGQPPQPWPDLPPGWPELSGAARALPVPAAQALHLSTPQRLAHWGKRQLEGG